jgi:hypothetical protein
MKRISFLLLGGFALSAFACEQQDGPTAEEVQAKFERGITGGGQINPIDRSNDPYVKPRDPGTVAE